jgi:hypothetical protein
VKFEIQKVRKNNLFFHEPAGHSIHFSCIGRAILAALLPSFRHATGDGPGTIFAVGAEWVREAVWL